MLHAKRQFYLSCTILGVLTCAFFCQRVGCVAWWQTVLHDLLRGLKERLAATLHCHGKVKTTDTLGGLPPPYNHLNEKKAKQANASPKIT